MEKFVFESLELLYHQIKKTDKETYYSWHRSTITPSELRYYKYKQLYIIYNLQQLDLCNEIASIELPNLDFLYEDWGAYLDNEDSDEDYYEWYEQMDEYSSELGEISQRLLSEIIKNTSWDLNIVTTVDEYEILSDELIKNCNKEISFYWGALNKQCLSKYESKRLTNLNCKPIEYMEFYPFCHVFLTNKKLGKILRSGEKNSIYNPDINFDKILEIMKNTLFYRFFPEFSHFSSIENESYIESYILGEFLETGESISFYHLDYSQIIGLLLIDHLVSEILITYDYNKD